MRLGNQEEFNRYARVRSLDAKMYSEIGMAICYMDYYHLDWFPKKKPKETNSPERNFRHSGYDQRVRVENLIKNYLDERINNYKPGNESWFEKQIAIFIDETENMC